MVNIEQYLPVILFILVGVALLSLAGKKQVTAGA